MLGKRLDTYTLLGERGLAALFFIAGLDLDLKRVRGRPLKLAIAGAAVLSVLLFPAAAQAFLSRETAKTTTPSPQVSAKTSGM